MLRRLRIENLVLIREAELELGPGLNAITGETGAGKTILAQAIGLLLGAKGDASYLGAGAEEAYVEAELDESPVCNACLSRSPVNPSPTDLPQPFPDP